MGFKLNINHRGGFKLVTIIFINDGYFPYLGKITNIQWDEVVKQQQITVDAYSGGLRSSGGHLNPYTLSCYPI